MLSCLVSYICKIKCTNIFDYCTYRKHCIFVILLSSFNSQKRLLLLLQSSNFLKRKRKKNEKKICATFCLYLSNESCKTYCHSTNYCIQICLLKVHSRVWDNSWQSKALQKWWKMIFMSSQKRFSFLRYLHFWPDFFII